ncbi:MAG TPA: hypothetical protein VE843_08275, partial [Ktedonobacteraceae bacterium]|nr:hypothetical protein [Ktedonobacteraceae bacterium]
MQKVQQSTPAGTATTALSRRKTILLTSLAALGAGLVGSLTSVFVMFILRAVAGIPTPMELFGDHILKLLPAPRFVDMLIFFGQHSKTTPLGLALLGMIGLGTLLGLLFAAIVRVKLPTSGYRPAWREWLTALIFALAMTTIAVVLFWVEIGQNFLGLPVGMARLVTALALLVDFSIYSLTLCLAFRILLPKQR